MEETKNELSAEEKKKNFTNNLVLKIAKKKYQEKKPLKDFELEALAMEEPDEDKFWKDYFKRTDRITRYGFNKRIVLLEEPIARTRIRKNIESKDPQKALDFINNCQNPIIRHGLNTKKANQVSKFVENSIERGLPLYIEVIDKVSDNIVLNGNYSQHLQASTFLGTDPVKLLTTGFIKGKQEGKTEEEIKKDFSDVMQKRYCLELELVEVMYANHQVLSYLTKNAQTQIEENIKELKNGKALDELIK